MPEVRQRAAALIPVRAQLAELSQAGQAGPPGGLAEVKALEARLHEGLEWFAQSGIQLKGIAPILVDFPAVIDGREILLCWLEGEPALAWWHAAELGFMGRRPLDELNIT